MEKYKAGDLCSKCGYNKHKITYCKPNTFGDNCLFDIGVEHMHIECYGCKYEWIVACIDKKEMVELQKIRKIDLED